MNYTFSKYFVLRRPNEPINTYFNLIKNVVQYEKKLFYYFKNKKNLEGLYISSKDLYFEFQKLKNWTDLKYNSKITQSLTKYLIRQATRPTPFGTFAGVGIGEIGKHEEFLLGENCPNSKTFCRLDMKILIELSNTISKIPNIQNELIYKPNNTIYHINKKIRLLERSNDRNDFQMKISEIEKNSLLNKIISQLKKKPRKKKEIISLIEENNISNCDAIEFFNTLIDFQVLICELEPNVIGSDYLEKLITILSKIDLNHEFEMSEEKISATFLKNKLIEIKTILLNINQSGQIDMDSFLLIQNSIDAILKNYDSKNIFHVDTQVINSSFIFDKSIIKEVKDCINVIDKLSLAYKPKRLLEFKENFLKKYGDKQINLMEALDTDFGIGYNKNIKNNTDKFQEFNYIENFLLEKLFDFKISKSDYIEISDQDLKKIENSNIDNCPGSMSCVIQLLTYNDNNKVYINSVGGSSGANLISRFFECNPNFNNLIDELVSAENLLLPSNFKLAEINYSVDSRASNILRRPKLREFEIPIFANSELSQINQINLDDLYISVKSGQLILYSKKIKKYIIPILSSAHNYLSESNNPIYLFLGDYQFSYFNNGVHFNWGLIEKYHFHLPRIMYKGNIISKEKWRINSKTIIPILNKKKEMTIFLKNNNIPLCFLIVEGDNEILIDTRNKISLEIFKNFLQKKPFIIIEEFLFFKYSSPIKDNNNSQYSNQIVLFLKKKSHNNLYRPELNIESIKSKRYFLPFSKWIYFNLYCGKVSGDEVLLKFIKRIVSVLENNKLIIKWFFIRYNDDENHLRFRINMNNDDNIAFIIEIFNKKIEPFIMNRIIKRFNIDIYERELERYGSKNIEIFENLFFLNSKYVIKILSKIKSENFKWLIGLYYTDKVLDAFNLCMNKKLDLLNKSASNYLLEFEKKLEIKKKIDIKYRLKKNEIFTFLNNKCEFDEDKKNIFDLTAKILTEQKRDILKIIKNSSTNQNKLNNSILSFLHMFYNRLFNDNQRFIEMESYFILCKYYKYIICNNNLTTKKNENVD
jgi:thiopeptide-type bacteriocin biosynthesis protein